MTRVPIDLPAATRDVKNRCARIAASMEAVAQLSDPVFADPRQVWLEVTVATHELESIQTLLRKAWWP